MNVAKYNLLILLCLCIGLSAVSCGKLKLVAFKGPFGGGFLGAKVRTPKFLGLGHGGGGFGFGGHVGGFGGGHHHESHHEHHEYHHESYHSSGGYGGGGWLGK